MKPGVNYINRKQTNWCKLTEELVSEKGDNIDIYEMWEELNGGIKSIIKKQKN